MLFKIKGMKKILMLFAIASLVSCECGKKKKVKSDGYTDADISLTYHNGIKKGKMEAIDSISRIEQPKTPTPVNTAPTYNAEDFDLPSGEVMKYSPNDTYINDNSEGERVSFDIYVHIKGSDGIRTVHKTEYKTWLLLREGSILE
jgi:hypothetical protein